MVSRACWLLVEAVDGNFLYHVILHGSMGRFSMYSTPSIQEYQVGGLQGKCRHYLSQSHILPSAKKK